MLKASKTLAGLMIKKITALVVAYSFLATSVWSLNPPGTTVRGGSPAHQLSWSALRGPLGNWLDAQASRRYDALANATLAAAHSKIFANFAGSNAPEAMVQSGGASTTVNFFGPHQYVRTTGDPNTYTTTVQVPAWVINPFNLHIQNGEADGSFRVSSATILVNNVQVAGPTDFNQQVFTLDRSVTLTPTTTLVVTLASKPGSYLRINLGGENADHTPPIVTIAAPAADINTPLAHFDIQYQDLPGAGEPAASGVNTATLQVLIDGVDRTSLFTKRSSDASADLPASLALVQGAHNVTASIQDNAGNTGTAALQFEVDTTPPVISFQQPAADSFLNNTTPQIVLAYSDNFALNLSSLKVVTGTGTDITSAFTSTATGASGTAPALPQGGNTIIATISDQAGNSATTSVTFNVDTTPPTITIVHPAAGSIHGNASVDYLIQYKDDQAIDPSTLVVSVDGNSVSVTPGAASTSGTLTLGNGSGHVLTATIKDKAGNTATTSSTFTIDTTVPNIHILQPVNNSFLNNPTPVVQVQYSEGISGIDTSTFKASVDGTDLTTLFNVGASSASATLQTPLADGSHTFSAQIASSAGNVGQTSSQVLIDTIKPQLTIVSPTGAVNTTTPVGLAQYSDTGSGIDPNSVHVTLDGVDLTGTFGVGSASVTGTLGTGAGLSESMHQFAVSVADKAGNIAQASSSFLVDVTPPTAVFASPANNSFINNTQPTITLNYSDAGSGVNLSSIHVFLQQGTAPETEITSLFTFAAAQGTATIPASSPLAPGTYHLRAVVADNAGNQAAPTSTFALDTTPPTYIIVTPAPNAFLNTSTPAFTVTYQDDSSGVDTSKFALQVDGVDRTADLTVTPTSASGSLKPADALADGTHQVTVTVFDRAGNQAPVVPQSFLVDTVPPTISITAPAAGSFTNNNRTPINVTYSDSGSGVDVTTFQLLVDGVDHSADLTITPTGATGSLSTVLLDGTHSIVANIKDLAGNPATANAAYTLDTVPPQIVITQPANGSFTNAASLTVLGTVTGAAPVASVTINGVSAQVSGNSFTSGPIQLGADGSSTTVTVIATDAAGNSAQQTVTVTVDRTPPQVTFAQPVDGSFTNATSVIAMGTVTGAAPVASITVNGVNASLSGNAFTSAPIPLGADGSSTTITAIATDTAGNSSAPKTVTVNVDRTAPQIIINQPVDGSFTNATSVTVSGTVTGTASVASVTVNGINASLSGGSFTSAPIQLGADGSSTTITVIAKDSAGNSSSPKSVTVTVDRTPPLVTFTQPADGSFTNATSVVAAGTVTSIAPVASLTINGVLTPLSGNSFTSAPIQLGADGSSTAITASAIDAAGNVSAPKTVTVTVDRTQPTITLATPDTITPLHPGQITATVQDVVPVTQVVISVNNITLATLTGAPFQVTVAVPAGSNPGDTLTVNATVTDVAGNTASATPHSVRVGADGGVIVGHVLDDLTGLPLVSANVQIIAATTPAITTDSQGRYSLQASSAHVFLTLSIPPSPPASMGTITVEREVLVQPGAGTVPVDARLTTLAQGVGIGSSGGTLSAGTISVSVPSGSAPDGSTFQLTSLSGQGLPNLLPLGWSVVAAFDLRSSASPARLNATIAQVPNTVADLVVYSSALHAWTMVAQSLQVVNGSVTFPVPGVGTYALVVPDTATPPIPVPAAGSPLTGIAMQALDPSVVGAISLNPPVLPAGGGTSTASVNLQAPTLSPSGTVVQANVSETFSLASGDKVSEETRSEDVVLYNALAATTPAMVAQFPLTPSHKYTNAQLVSGNVHLDILSGREGVRGTPGGNDPVTVTDGIATLSVPGHALGVDTAIAVQSTSLETFVPTSTIFSAIQEVVVDFSGETLNTPAQLSIPSTGLNPADTFLLTQVVRINGVPHMVAAAVAQVSGQNLTSGASPGLPGVVAGGEYVFYDIASTSGVGFVTGIAKTGAGPVQALVQTDSLPIVSISGLVDGRYIVPALAGTVNLKANGTTSSVAGTASTPLTAGQLATVDILLNGVVNTATVSPADKSLGVPVSTIITITSPVPINPSTIVPANLVLFQGTPAAPGAAVPLQTTPPFILSASGTVLTFAPAQNLNPATQYTIQVAGLADMGGGAIVVPTSSFTTLANQPLTFDPNTITFAFPDANGNIHVSAPAGSLSAGTKVLIVDQSNAVVLSLTAFNDGSLTGDFPGTINDTLQVTVTDPNGATASFTRSQFVAADGSVAVGPGGGTVTGPGGVAMIIPAGALDQGVVFSLKPLDQSAFPQLPSVPGINFGSGIQIHSASKPFFKQEVKLAFPVPANAPPNAFYYVYRQITDPSNNVYFETIDHAFVQGSGASAQVVTASPPFCGFMNFYGDFQKAATASFSGGIAAPFPQIPGTLEDLNVFILWDQIQNNDPNQPGVASQGLIVGKALQTIAPGPGQTEPTFAPLEGAIVWIGSSQTQPSQNVAITSGACGEFTIFDPQLGGGARTVTAQAPSGVSLQATANEVNGIQVDDATFLVTAGLEQQYRNIGHVNFTFPPVTQPPPPPVIDIRLFTLDSSKDRVFASSTLASATPLVIAIRSSLQITGASIGTKQLTIQGDYLDNPKDPQAPLDFRATDPASLDVLNNYVTGNPGSYTLTVTGVSPLGGPPSTASKSFLVVAPGGANNSPTPGQAPDVIGASPPSNAQRVPTSIFPDVEFSEPVTNIPGNVSFTDSGGNAPPILLVGVRADGTVANPIGSSDAITTLTIQPLTGLKFNTQYTLQLSAAIVDQNSPPLKLTPFTLQFTTVGPHEIDTNPEQFSSTRPVVIGDRAYVGQFLGAALSQLDVIDISDPTNPIDLGERNTMEGHVVDIAGLASSPVNRCLTEVLPGAPCPTAAAGGPLVAMAATMGATDSSIPSNIFIYDVSDPDHPARVGAVSATTSVAQDGSLLRIVMKDQFVFASTLNKGLQMIDLQQAVNDFQQTPVQQFGPAVSIDGNGFALDAVVNTIPVPVSVPNGSGGFLAAPAVMWDLKAGDFATAPPDPNNPSAPVPTQTLIVATGRVPFVVADPQQGGSAAILYPSMDSTGVGLSVQPLIDVTGQTQFAQGRAVALGSIPVFQLVGGVVNQPIAVVVGTGTSNGKAANLLTVVDTTDPKHPAIQGAVVLVDQNGQPVIADDVILQNSLALVGTPLKKVLLVDLTDPRRPLLAGEIDGTLGDRLALTDSGIVVTASGNAAIGGIHTAIFGSQCAAYRKLLQSNNFAANPPSLNNDLHLSWTVSGGFSVPMENGGGSLNQDGFVLKNVMLGRRQMAQTWSLPYFELVRSGTDLRCHLFTSNDNACTGEVPGVSARSRLMQYTAQLAPDATNFYYEAKFLIDHLDGDPDTQPDVPDSCVVLTQRYEFYREGLRPLEPFGFFPSAQFKPLVKYNYFTDSGPPVQMLTTAQRMHFDVQTPNTAPAGQPAITASLKSPVNGMMLACDPDPVIAPFTCLPGVVQAAREGQSLLDILNASLLGVFGDNSPLPSEAYVSVIQNGQSVANFDPSRNIKNIIDNIHQFPTPATNQNQAMDEPGLTHFGCPACVHIHPRWSWVFKQQNIETLANVGTTVASILTGGLVPPEAIPLATAIAGGLAANILDPTFDNNNGLLKIPPNSPQNVDVAILRSGGAEEQHLPGTVKDLFNSHGGQVPFGQSILPTVLDPLNVTPVIWYVASSSLPSDTFFLHGGGFGTFYVNRIVFPASGSGQPLALNVEHSRAVNYTVTPKRWDFILVPGTLAPTPVPLPPTTLFSQTGRLDGIDDIPNLPGPDTDPDLVFGPNTLQFTVDVTLDDPTLSPKHLWIRTFTFKQPEPQEP